MDFLAVENAGMVKSVGLAEMISCILPGAAMKRNKSFDSSRSLEKKCLFKSATTKTFVCSATIAKFSLKLVILEMSINDGLPQPEALMVRGLSLASEESHRSV